jgi:hypothetical protein
MKREARMKIGLPATPEVGILGHLAQDLISKVESELSIEIQSATLAIEHLVALYQDDVEDLCGFLKLDCAKPIKMFKPIFWETSAAYAGYGLGLCEHYKDKAACDSEDKARHQTDVLAVHYSRGALASSLAVLYEATSIFEPDLLHLEDFTLGKDAAKDFPSPEQYWEDVRQALLRPMVKNPYARKPQIVIVTGDAVDGGFIKVLEDSLRDHLGEVPKIYAGDAATVASKGAAELRRRIPYYRASP